MMSKFNKLLNQKKKEKIEQTSALDQEVTAHQQPMDLNIENISPIQRRVSQGVQHGAALKRIDVDLIDHSPYQPRMMSATSQNSLAELAENIRHHGQINPILVRPKNGRYELIGGERRLYAIKVLLKLKDIDCLIKDISDEKAAVTALVDNINRADLSDYEIAAALKNNCELFGYPLEQVDFITEKFNISRNKYYRLISLFDLPNFIHAALNENPKCFSGSAASLLKTALNKAKDQIGIDLALKILEVEWQTYLTDFSATNKINTQFIKDFEHKVKQRFEKNHDQQPLVHEKKQQVQTKSENLLSAQEYQLNLLNEKGKKIGSVKCEDSLKGKKVISVRLTVNDFNDEKMQKLKKFLEMLD